MGCWDGMLGWDVGMGCWDGMLGWDVGMGCKENKQKMIEKKKKASEKSGSTAKDYYTEFSYPLEIDNFTSVVERFFKESQSHTIPSI
ncbi:unnamed protein product [Allacma fusca]|uniref:Uncharacterized protein n=1 Tax=Allacma fusca TaxID=39272 RepID=A0A8J2JT34_9HEXA|nr:unnamed protein product [Allacma fusca]